MTTQAPALLLLSLALVLLAVGSLVLWRARAKHRDTGLPQGQVIYDDTGAWQECPRPLFSRRYLLTGKPDYIVAQGDYLIPVEVKPSRTAAKPYLSDVLQLVAYCLLIEEDFNRAPPYGLLRYQRDTYCIEYDSRVRRQLLGTMEKMRADLRQLQVGPSHNSPRRCGACGHREQCEARLDGRASAALGSLP
jgi:CRISPR-associated exonuclease Cas4